MIVNTYAEVDELAKAVVLKEMKDNPNNIERLDEVQKHNTLAYLVYNDLCRQEPIVGAYFAKRMENTYGIKIYIG